MKMIKRTVQATLVLVLLCSAVFAQSLADAKKATDAEQYQKAKNILKNLIKSKPADAENYFYLGNVYLKTDNVDSAKLVFNQGVAADKEYALNYVGLGSIDLAHNDKVAAKANFEKAQSLVKKKDDGPALYTGKAYTLAASKILEDRTKKADAAKALAAPYYEAAISYLQSTSNLKAAVVINPKDAEVFVAIGDAYRDRNTGNDAGSAYSNYQSAIDLDKTLVRANLELAIIQKRAFAWNDAVKSFNNIIQTNKDYAPAYRELAETYLLWARAEPAKDYDAHVKAALQNYDTYMSLTDKSLESRIRHADFLVWAKEWKLLQTEAAEMSKIPGANEKVLRYQGFAAFQNKDYPTAEKALDQWITKADPTRVIAEDYLYRGQSRVNIGIGPPVDNVKIVQGLADLKTALPMDTTQLGANAATVDEVGKALQAAKLYDLAADAFQIATVNPGLQARIYDYIFIGTNNWTYYQIKYSRDTTENRLVGGKPYLQKADDAFATVIKLYPAGYPDAFYWRAKIAKEMEPDQKNLKGGFVPLMENFITTVSAKADQTAGEKAHLLDATKSIALFITPKPASLNEAMNPRDQAKIDALLIVIDKADAQWKKVQALDPNDAYAKIYIEAFPGWKTTLTTPPPPVTPAKPGAGGTQATPAK